MRFQSLGRAAEFECCGEKAMRYNWPPRILFNTDGCLAFKYLCRRNPDDVTEMIDQLAGTGVDVLTVVVGINDDLWGKTWGADIREVLPDGGRPAGGAFRLRVNYGAGLRPEDARLFALYVTE